MRAMDERRFDALTQQLVSGSSRRRVLAGLTRGILALAPFTLVGSESAAKKKGKGKGKGKKKKKKRKSATIFPLLPSPPPPNPFAQGCTIDQDSCTAGVNIPCPGNSRYGDCVIVDGQPFCSELTLCGTCETDGDCGPGRRCISCSGCAAEGGKACVLHSCGPGQIPAGPICVTGQGTCPNGATSCATAQDPVGTTVPCNNIPGCRCFQSVLGETRCGKNLPQMQCGQCNSDGGCANFGFGAFCVVTTAPGTNCSCAEPGQGFCQLPC
jgi:hypothetical protein